MQALPEDRAFRSGTQERGRSSYSSSPEIFYREILRILEGMEGVVVHMGDVLVFGDNAAEHDKRLQRVLKRVKESGMTLN